MAVNPASTDTAASPLARWVCTSTADVAAAPQVPVHTPRTQIQCRMLSAELLSAQGRALLAPLTHLPDLELFALAPVSLRRQVPPCRCVDVLLLRHSAPIARRFLSVQGVPLPSCTFLQSLKSVQIIPFLPLCSFPSPTLLLLSPSQQAQPRHVINTCHFVSNLLQEEQRGKCVKTRESRKLD